MHYLQAPSIEGARGFFFIRLAVFEFFENGGLDSVDVIGFTVDLNDMRPTLATGRFYKGRKRRFILGAFAGADFFVAIYVPAYPAL